MVHPGGRAAPVGQVVYAAQYRNQRGSTVGFTMCMHQCGRRTNLDDHGYQHRTCCGRCNKGPKYRLGQRHPHSETCDTRDQTHQAYLTMEQDRVNAEAHNTTAAQAVLAQTAAAALAATEAAAEQARLLNVASADKALQAQQARQRAEAATAADIRQKAVLPERGSAILNPKALHDQGPTHQQIRAAQLNAAWEVPSASAQPGSSSDSSRNIPAGTAGFGGAPEVQANAHDVFFTPISTAREL